MKKENQCNAIFLSSELKTKSPNDNRSIIDQTFLFKLHPRSTAAKLLGIGHQTLDKLIDEGRIKVIFVGRKPKIPGTEIERFISESLVTPETLSKTKKIYDLNSFRNGGNDFKNSFDTMKLFEKMSLGVANG